MKNKICIALSWNTRNHETIGRLWKVYLSYNRCIREIYDYIVYPYRYIFFFLQDFPSKGWLIRFSDLIGASHTNDYRFWRYSNNGMPHTQASYMASIGLQQVAEIGGTRKLESELKDRVGNICIQQMKVRWKLCKNF